MFEGFEHIIDPSHPQFKRAPNQPGTLREQLDIIHGRAPAEPLPDSHNERLAAAMMADPETWGTLLLHLIRVAQAAEMRGAA